MLELLEFLFEFLPDLMSLGDVLRSARNGNAEFEQKLAVMGATTLAQHQHRMRARPADGDGATAR